MQKKSLIKQNILKHIDFIGLSRYEFYKKTGITRGILDQDNGMSEENTAKYLAYFENINTEWLLTGKGSMFKQDLNDNDLVLNEPKAVYKLKTDKVIDDHQQIPLYNLEATAGIVTLFRDAEQTQPVDYIQIPNLPKCDGALYVTGDSMYPLLKSGDIIMYKQVHNIKDGIFWGEMYLVSIDQDGDELVLVKYIQKSEKGENYIRLVSQNQHHQDKDVKLSKIKALALVKASIRINSMS